MTLAELIFTHAGSKLEVDTRRLAQDLEPGLGELVGHEDTYVGHGYSYGIRLQKPGAELAAAHRRGQGGTGAALRPSGRRQG